MGSRNPSLNHLIYYNYSVHYKLLEKIIELSHMKGDKVIVYLQLALTLIMGKLQQLG